MAFVTGSGLVDDWTVRLAALALCLVGVAFLSSIETALSGVPESRVRLALERGAQNAQHLRFWLEAPGRVLATLHLIRLACVVGAGLSAAALAHKVHYRLPDAAITIVVSLMALIIGHLLPRVVAKRYALDWALSTIRIVKVLTTLLGPVVWPLMMLTRMFARWCGASTEGTGSAPFWIPGEVDKLADEARAETLDEAGENLYRSIIEFSDTVVGEIMVPRTDMVAVAVGTEEKEVRDRARTSGHSRIPVYEETIDNILGLLYVKDLSAPSPGGEANIDLAAIVRPTFYVPEVMKISELLREVQRRKTHMAIVVDEYGGTAGLDTLEDIIEEIVGEIQDEYDVEEKQYRLLGDNKIVADGRIRLWDLEEPLGVEFPEEGGYESLAGFITARAGFLPAPGTVISWNNLLFTVKEANEKRIGTVEIERRKTDLSPNASP